jgi:hypothetical protein
VGAAVLSLVSPRAERIVRMLLCPWPALWQRLVLVRGWLAEKLLT